MGASAQRVVPSRSGQLAAASLTSLTSPASPTTTFHPSVNTLPRAHFSSDINPVHQKIDGFVKNAKVVVFMKGVPTAPQCGFSNAVVQIMR